MRWLIIIIMSFSLSCGSTEQESKKSTSDTQFKQIGKYSITGQPSQKAEEHTQGYVDILTSEGFYQMDARKQKVIALSAMLKYEGWDFEEVEQKEGNVSIFNNFYWSKNLAYQLGVRYGSDGLMELIALQVHYMNPNTGEISTTHKIK